MRVVGTSPVYPSFWLFLLSRYRWSSVNSLDDGPTTLLSGCSALPCWAADWHRSIGQRLQRHWSASKSERSLLAGDLHSHLSTFASPCLATHAGRCTTDEQADGLAVPVGKTDSENDVRGHASHCGTLSTLCYRLALLLGFTPAFGVICVQVGKSRYGYSKPTLSCDLLIFVGLSPMVSESCEFRICYLLFI